MYAAGIGLTGIMIALSITFFLLPIVYFTPVLIISLIVVGFTSNHKSVLFLGAVYHRWQHARGEVEL
jgi:hypothetical protein